MALDRLRCGSPVTVMDGRAGPPHTPFDPSQRLNPLLRLLLQPSVGLLGVSVIVAMGLRRLFFRFAPWLWHFALPVANSEVLYWARTMMMNRDGAEP